MLQSRQFTSARGSLPGPILDEALLSCTALLSAAVHRLPAAQRLVTETIWPIVFEHGLGQDIGVPCLLWEVSQSVCGPAQSTSIVATSCVFVLAKLQLLLENDPAPIFKVPEAYVMCTKLTEDMNLTNGFNVGPLLIMKRVATVSRRLYSWI